MNTPLKDKCTEESAAQSACIAKFYEDRENKKVIKSDTAVFLSIVDGGLAIPVEVGNLHELADDLIGQETFLDI